MLLVGAGRDRARGVERDVRGQRGEHARGADRDRVAAIFSCAVSGTASTGRSGEHALPGRGEVVDQPALLLELRARSAPSRAGSAVSSSSPLTAGAVPPSSSTSALSCEQARGRRRVGLRRRRATSSDLADVALGERALAAPRPRRRSARCCEREVARIESPTLERREERERDEDRDDRARGRAWRTGRNATSARADHRDDQPRVHAAEVVAGHVAEQLVATWREMKLPHAMGSRVVVLERADACAASTASSSTVRSSARKGRSWPSSRTRSSSWVSGPRLRTRRRHAAGGDALGGLDVEVAHLDVDLGARRARRGALGRGRAGGGDEREHDESGARDHGRRGRHDRGTIGSPQPKLEIGRTNSLDWFVR